MLFLGLSAVATPAAARDPILNLPIDCTLGETCFILNYVDADGGPGAADYTCGPHSYDANKGTDFALPTLHAMQLGVNVLAATPGRVAATTDGIPDSPDASPDAPDSEAQECGNGVVIDHGGGWQTQYCHLKQGSIAVAKGQRVRMGAVLGQVGLSGKTAHPHLHFVLRHNGEVTDPFNRDGITTCGEPDPTDTLWQHMPDYRPGAGIAGDPAPSLPD